MATNQANITEIIAQIGAWAARVMVHAMAMASAENNQRAQSVGPKIRWSIYETTNIWLELQRQVCRGENFRMEVKNMFQNYNINQTERVQIIKSWLGREDLQQLETLSQPAQEAYNNEEYLFETLGNRFKPQYNETIKSLQFHKLVRHHNESIEEWIGRLRITATDCKYNDIES